jgi:hypothetical protein
MSKLKNQTVFPIKETIRDINNVTLCSQQAGIKKIEHFTSLAMQGIVSNEFMIKDILTQRTVNDRDIPLETLIARFAVKLANATLKEIEKL